MLNAWRSLRSWRWARDPAPGCVPQASRQPLLLAQAWLMACGWQWVSQGKEGDGVMMLTGLPSLIHVAAGFQEEEAGKHFLCLLVLPLPVSHGLKPSTRPAQDWGWIEPPRNHCKGMRLWRGR